MAYDLHITGPHTRTVIELRGARPRLPAPVLPDWPDWPARPNSRTIRGERSLLWVGPDCWLLLAPLTQEPALEATLCPLSDDATSITALSDSLAFFTLSGADAGVAMAIACPLDLHPTAFAPDTATFTEAFGTRALTLRDGPTWHLATSPSHAPYITECLRGMA